MAKPRLEPTPEFYRFGLGFYQDLDRTGKTEDEVRAIVLDPFTDQDRIRLREFLDRITQDAVPDADLLRLWNATPPDCWVRDLRVMLRQAHDRLLQPPNRPSWRGHDRSGRRKR